MNLHQYGIVIVDDISKGLIPSSALEQPFFSSESLPNEIKYWTISKHGVSKFRIVLDKCVIIENNNQQLTFSKKIVKDKKVIDLIDLYIKEFEMKF